MNDIGLHVLQIRINLPLSIMRIRVKNFKEDVTKNVTVQQDDKIVS